MVGGLLLVLLSLSACAPAADSSGSAVVRDMVVGNKVRTHILYVPKAVAPKPALVLLLHGRGGNGAEIRERTRRSFETLADAWGFIVAYPDSLRGHWNDGHPWATADADDVEYLAALVAQLIAENHVDGRRVFVTGFSNGAGMAYRLACDRPDLVAAVAPVSGGLAQSRMQPCAAASKRPIPLLVIHGTDDPVNPFDDGELEGNVQYWIRRNGCALQPAMSYLPQAEPAGSRTRVERWEHCAAPVTLYALEGCGHHWPDGDEPFRWHPQGPTCRTFDGAQAIWDFFGSVPVG